LRPNVIAESDDALFLVAAAIHRGCLAIVPESAARSAIADGALRTVEILDAPGLAVHALFHDSTLARSAIGMLRDRTEATC
jgi:DNA-binding transcriptional LysR family regulator